MNTSTYGMWQSMVKHQAESARDAISLRNWKVAENHLFTLRQLELMSLYDFSNGDIKAETTALLATLEAELKLARKINRQQRAAFRREIALQFPRA